MYRLMAQLARHQIGARKCNALLTEAGATMGLHSVHWGVQAEAGYFRRAERGIEARRSLHGRLP